MQELSSAVVLDDREDRLAHRIDEAEAIAELERHTKSFAQAVCESLGDFFGMEPQCAELVEIDKGYRPQGNVHVSIPFSGLVNGEYILNLEESYAAEILGEELPESDDPAELEEIREEIGSALSELLNTAVGTVIGELGDRYPHLNFSSPRICYGVRVYPRIRFGSADLRGDDGDMRCHLYLDHMELDLATLYAKLEALSEQTCAALASQALVMGKALGAVSSAVFWVRPDGEVSSRFSSANTKMLGVDKQALSGKIGAFAATITQEPTMADRVDSWLQRVFASTTQEDWKDNVEPHCPLLSSTRGDGRHLSWRWLPVRVEDKERPNSLLVAIDELDSEPQLATQDRKDLAKRLTQAGWVLYTQDDA